ncbi:MAG: 50S ribosomal protein L24 [Nanoarchaeota archaeon]|nr:50S ribosomal protein L24 [Nanoarchaeota archaeon]
MPKCIYCGNQYEIPRGVTIVTNEGTPHHFCSSKCRKNKSMKRRKVRWVIKKDKNKKEE